MCSASSGKGVYVTIDELMKFLIHHGNEKAIVHEQVWKSNMAYGYLGYSPQQLKNIYEDWKKDECKWMMDGMGRQPTFGEYTIYEPPHDVLRDIYRTKKDTVYVIGKAIQYNFNSPKDIIRAGKKLKAILKHDFSDLEEIVGDKAREFGFLVDSASCS